jgi:hypothetical protein
VFKLFLYILLLIIGYKLFAPLFRGIGNLFKPTTKKEQMEKEQDYSELSPYEIEDAEYEEVSKDKD